MAYPRHCICRRLKINHVSSILSRERKRPGVLITSLWKCRWIGESVNEWLWENGTTSEIMKCSLVLISREKKIVFRCIYITAIVPGIWTKTPLVQGFFSLSFFLYLSFFSIFAQVLIVRQNKDLRINFTIYIKGKWLRVFRLKKNHTEI